MDLRVLGCHGGETPRHRTTAFLIDERLTIDAGCLTSQLELSEQVRLRATLVSHAHLDHIRDLATIADNRCQLGCPPLVVAAPRATIAQLRAHFFNNVLWPDFARIPDPSCPAITYLELPLGEAVSVGGYQVVAVPVDHTIESAGFIISDGRGSLGFSGDTGPTDELWRHLNARTDLRALLMEVSFPNRQQALAEASGHHTPQTLGVELQKLVSPMDVPTLLYHIKPPFQSEVELECAKLRGVNLHVLALKDQFIL